MTRRRLNKIGINALGLLVFAVMVFPDYWMVSTAFKEGRNILSDTPQFFPSPATLSNFEDVIDRPFLLGRRQEQPDHRHRGGRFSLVVGFLAALALAKFRFHGRAVFIVLILGVQMVPLNALIIPLYIQLSKAGLTNELRVIITYLTFVPPHGLDVARLPARDPAGAGGGGDGRWEHEVRRLRPHPAAAGRAGARRPRSSRSSSPGTST